MADTLALESLGFFLPVALKALEATGLYSIERSDALKKYRSTYDMLVEAI